MWIKQGNSEYISGNGLWLVRPHTDQNGDNIKGDWALYAFDWVLHNAGVDHWDYVASATTLRALKRVAV